MHNIINNVQAITCKFHPGYVTIEAACLSKRKVKVTQFPRFADVASASTRKSRNSCSTHMIQHHQTFNVYHVTHRLFLSEALRKCDLSVGFEWFIPTVG